MRKLTAPSCLYLWRWSLGGVLRCLQYLREKKKFFHEKKLCYNCEREGQGGNHSRSRPCSKCKSRHLTSLWDKISVKGQSESMVFTPYTQVMKIDSYQRSFRWSFKAQHCGHIWTRALAGILHPKKLSLKPSLHERHRIVIINGVWRHFMPIFKVRSHSLDNPTSEQIENNGNELANFTTTRRPTIGKLKSKYEHARDKLLYTTRNKEYPVHVILGDQTYCKIWTKLTFKGRLEDPSVAGTMFGWVTHDGAECANDKCSLSRRQTNTRSHTV